MLQKSSYAIVNDVYTYNRIRKDFKATTLEDGVIMYKLQQISRKYIKGSYKLKMHILTLTEETKHKPKDNRNVKNDVIEEI